MGRRVDVAGVIESALDFVQRHIEVQAWIEESDRRAERWDYPLETVREALVNAVAHPVTVRLRKSPADAAERAPSRAFLA